MIHGARKLANLILSLSQGGTPLRHTRGVVVSSNIGETVVTLDGGTTQITAYNYGHSSGFPAGAVVDLLLVDGQAYVIGSYDGEVPVGGLVARTIFPVSTSNISTATTFANGQIIATLIAGYQYSLTFTINKGQQITAAGTGATQVWVTDSAGLIQIDGGNLRGGIVFAPAVSTYLMSSGETILSPSSTVSDTFTVHGQSPGTGALQIAANCLELVLKRVA